MEREELMEDLNETLRRIWKAGRKIDNVTDYKDFTGAMLLAVIEGWDAETDSEIDHTYAVMS